MSVYAALAIAQGIAKRHMHGQAAWKLVGATYGVKGISAGAGR